MPSPKSPNTARAAERARGIFELSDKIEIELLDSRRAERDFLVRNDRKKAEIQRQIGKAVAADINDLHEKLLAIGKDDLAGKVEALAVPMRSERLRRLSKFSKRMGSRSSGCDPSSRLSSNETLSSARRI